MYDLDEPRDVRRILQIVHLDPKIGRNGNRHQAHQDENAALRPVVGEDMEESKGNADPQGEMKKREGQTAPQRPDLECRQRMAQRQQHQRDGESAQD